MSRSRLHGDKTLLIVSAAVLGPALVFVVFLAAESLRGGCSTPERGEFKDAAVIEGGYVRPFGALKFDGPGNWKMAFRFLEHPETREVTISGLASLKRAQSMTFECTRGDMATPSVIVTIYRRADVVYASGVIAGGLQNEEFGYLRASDEKLFTRVFRDMPEALLEPPIPRRD